MGELSTLERVPGHVYAGAKAVVQLGGSVLQGITKTIEAEEQLHEPEIDEPAHHAATPDNVRLISPPGRRGAQPARQNSPVSEIHQHPPAEIGYVATAEEKEQILRSERLRSLLPGAHD